MADDKHECHAPEGSPVDGYGAAVCECYELDDGTMWVENGEYGSQVNYCPFCGYEAKVKISQKGPR